MHGLQSQLSYTPLWLLALAQTFALFTDTHKYRQKWKSAKRFHSFHVHVYENATSSSRPPRLKRPQAGANASRERPRRARAKSKAVDTVFWWLACVESGLRQRDSATGGYGQDTTHVDTSARRRWRVERKWNREDAWPINKLKYLRFCREEESKMPLTLTATSWRSRQPVWESQSSESESGFVSLCLWVSIRIPIIATLVSGLSLWSRLCLCRSVCSCVTHSQLSI